MSVRSRAVLCLAAMIACFAAPAGATFSGSGVLVIQVRPEGSVDLVERAPAEVLPTDEIATIQIGTAFPALEIGTLVVDAEGDVASENGVRDLGIVTVERGDLSLLDSHTDGSLRLGMLYAGLSAFEMHGSRHRGAIDIHDGSADITGSTLDAELLIRRGTAALVGSSLHGFSAEPSEQAYVVLHSSTLDRQTPLVTQGRHTLELCTFASGGLDFGFGYAQWQDSSWTMSGPLRIGTGSSAASALTIDSSDVDATSIEITGGSPSVLQLRAGTDLDVSGDVGLDAPLGLRAQLAVQSGSSVALGGELSVVGPSAAAEIQGGVIDAGTRLALGAREGTCGSGGSSDAGTLRVADGGIAVVRGELLLCAGATLDLQPGGTVRAASLNHLGGTILENGGALIVPEAESVLACGIALAAVAALRFAAQRRSRVT